MGETTTSKVLAIVTAILGALLVVGALSFAGPCIHDDGSFSTCHNAQIGIIAGGVVAAVCSLIALFLKSSRVRSAASLVVAVAGVFIALSPGVVFPLCMMSTMRCHVVMQPFAQFMGAAIAVVGLIGAIRAFRARR